MLRKSRLTLLAIILVCTLPVVASYLTFYYWKPSETVNYGELIGPIELPDARGTGLLGQPDVDLAAIRGRWTLMLPQSGQCDDKCNESLYAMRQAWLAQDEDARRLDRLWLVTDEVAPKAETLTDQRGLKVARAASEWLSALPDASPGTYIYLVDPLGNVMMRFPAQPDVKGMIKDLRRLLKYSGLG